MSIYHFEKQEPEECAFLSSKIWEGQRISESHPWLEKNGVKGSPSKENRSSPVKAESLPEPPRVTSHSCQVLPDTLPLEDQSDSALPTWQSRNSHQGGDGDCRHSSPPSAHLMLTVF